MSTSPTTSQAPTPEDEYVANLQATGLFPGIDGAAREVWLRHGREACGLLRQNYGDLLDAGFTMGQSLADFSEDGEGYAADPSPDQQGIIIAEVASAELCPEIPAG